MLKIIGSSDKSGFKVKNDNDEIIRFDISSGSSIKLAKMSR